MNGTIRPFVSAFWAMEPAALQYWGDIVRSGIRAGVAPARYANDEADARAAVRIAAVATDTEGAPKQSRVFLGAPRYVRDCDAFNEREDDIVNLLQVTGPLTREWNCDNIGTRAMRDRILEANDDPCCRGHILFLNTPGGEAGGMHDMQFAREASVKAGKPWIGFIDGMAASLGCGIAALCDEVYFLNPHDQIGSIGVMASFATLRDGTKAKDSGVTAHFLYSKYSPDKNSWWRKSSEGDNSEVLEDLDRTAEQFIATIKSCRPTVTEEQTTGKMYPCGEVVGTMVEGQSTLSQCALRVVEICKKKKNSSTTNTRTTMAFNHLNAALEVEELVVAEGGSFLQEEQLEAIDALLGNQAQQAKEHQDAIAALEAQHASEFATAQTQHSEAIAAVQAEKEALQADKDALQADKDALQAEKDALQAEKAALQAEKEALEAENAQLAEQAPEPQAIEQPKDNNGAATAPDANTQSVCNATMTLEEKAAAVKARNLELRRAGLL